MNRQIAALAALFSVMLLGFACSNTKVADFENQVSNLQGQVQDLENFLAGVDVNLVEIRLGVLERDVRSLGSLGNLSLRAGSPLSRSPLWGRGSGELGELGSVVEELGSDVRNLRVDVDYLWYR